MKKKIDPELKEGIQEVVKAVDALVESDFPEAMGILMFKMLEAFQKAGFTREEAMELIVAHGAQIQKS